MLFFSVFLVSCDKHNGITSASKETEVSDSMKKYQKDYKAKVNKRVGKIVYKAAVKEMAEFGVTESQVKCMTAKTSYVTLNIRKDTPEVKAILNGCGINPDQLTGW